MKRKEGGLVIKELWCHHGCLIHVPISAAAFQSGAFFLKNSKYVIEVKCWTAEVMDYYHYILLY